MLPQVILNFSSAAAITLITCNAVAQPMAGGGSAALVNADFDKDGAPDLAASIPGANRVGVLMNTQ